MRWEELRGGAVNIEVEAHLRQIVESGKQLRVKLGIDPSAPDLHLGHTVVLRKMRQFQEAGHTAVLIIGDFTARIGDPSARSETRKPLTELEVEENGETYLQQFSRVMDRERTEVRRQSEWFGGMDLSEVIRLAGRSTVARLLQREDFTQRMEAGHSIGLHELLYPLLQGYDSIAVQSDLELGGTDQLFNLLFARDVQRDAGREPQDVLTMPLLEGLDGKQKMSKSLNNYVALTDPPAEMFGKLMSLPDELIVRYLRLVTALPGARVDEVERELAAGSNPRDAKALLASEVVRMYHGAHAAAEAEEGFVRQFREGGAPDQMEEVFLPAGVEGGSVATTLMVTALASSKNEARRLVAQRGVRLNGRTVEDPEEVYRPADGDVWQVGRRRYVRVRLGAS